MVEVTANDIKAYAPEMQSEGNERVEMFIEFGRTFVNEDKWGAKSKFGIILITCHLISMSNRDGAGGAITAERVGELSRSYGQASGNSNQELASTAYGQQFLMLRKTLVITPLVV